MPGLIASILLIVYPTCVYPCSDSSSVIIEPIQDGFENSVNDWTDGGPVQDVNIKLVTLDFTGAWRFPVQGVSGRSIAMARLRIDPSYGIAVNDSGVGDWSFSLLDNSVVNAFTDAHPPSSEPIRDTVVQAVAYDGADPETPFVGPAIILLDAAEVDALVSGSSILGITATWSFVSGVAPTTISIDSHFNPSGGTDRIVTLEVRYE